MPFGELQQQVLLAVQPELRVVVYRRLMLRIAEKLARRWRARALVTGEVVGQVASQTLENLTTIAGATTMEVLRPLVGMDKDEIVEQAQRLGTFPISIIPDQDCCQLFTPRHPATRARPEQIEAAEARAAHRRHGGRGDRRHRGGGVPIPDAVRRLAFAALSSRRRLCDLLAVMLSAGPSAGRTVAWPSNPVF